MGDAHPTCSRTAAIFTRLINLCWSLFQWCLLLAVAAALGIGGYLYFRLDDEIRRQVEQRLASHYSTLRVDVGRARFEQDRGIAIYDLTLTNPEIKDRSQPIVAIDEMYLAGKVRMEDLLTGGLSIDEIVVRRATLRAVRQPDGKWNIQALLPLPHFGDQSPVVKIEDATLLLEDAMREGSDTQTVQGIDLVLKPAAVEVTSTAAMGRFHITGTAKGLPARELRIEGDFGTTDGELNLTVTAVGLEISSELIAALPGISVADLRGVELSGRADASVRVSRSGEGASLNWSTDVKIDRGRLVHAMLPEPLTEITCIGRADQNRLTIERLDGKCGSASIALAAERSGWSADARVALAAKVVGLSLNDRLRSLLPASYVRVWQRFQPSGIVDADIRLTFDGQRWQPQLSANCRGLALTDAERFPYVLQQTTGKVEYQPAVAVGADQLRLDLTGFGGGRPVRIKAELTHLTPVESEGVTTDSGVATEPSAESAGKRAVGYRGIRQSRSSASPTRHPIGWVEITGSDIPLHEELIAALPAKGESLVRALRPQGAIDFRFRAEWKTVFQPRADVIHEIRLKDCTIQYDAFPFPLRHVQGLVTAQDLQWTIHDVEGRGGNDSTVVKCRGKSLPRGDEFRSDLIFEVTNVPLDDNLKLALPPHVQRAWAELRPQGRIDLTAHVSHDTEQAKPVIEVTLQPRERSVSVELVKFPYRLEQLEGEATYQAGRVELHNVLARHDRVEYSAAVIKCEPTPDGGWQLLLNGFNADHFSPHRDLLVALPTKMQHIIERLQPSGTISMHNSSLGFAVSPQVERVKATWDVNLICVQAALRGSVPVQSLTGEIRLVGRDDGQTSYTAGEMDLDSLVWKDVQLTNVRGPLWVDESACLLGEHATKKLGQPARRITADVYGGSLAANAELQHAGNATFQLDVALGGANLARFANERLGGPQDMSGTVSGRLLLSGAGQSIQTLDGRGELHVVDANIYELPALVAMLKVLRNRNPDTTAFNRCDMQFTIEGERINFQQLNLLGDAVSLYGKGESDFNRRLDLTFYTLIEPANLPIPLWKTIAGHVSQQALQLKVVGTWDNVEVQPQTLPGVNQVLEQIQTEFQAGAATMAPSTATRSTASPARDTR